MKERDQEAFQSLVKKQFCYLLGLEENNEANKEMWGNKRKSRKNSTGSRLTEERVDMIYQVIEYLGTVLQEEGLFRKSPSVKRMDELLHRLEERRLDLLVDEFSAHEAASALKSLLAGLAEPLLTDTNFLAVCKLGEARRESWLTGIRLLLQLVPGPEWRLLKDLLYLLHGTAARETCNRMSASALATVFMTHLLCPRWLPPDELAARYSVLNDITTFMVQETTKLFIVPPELVDSVQEFTLRRSSEGCISLARQKSPGVNKLIASTVGSFVDFDRVLSEENEPTRKKSFPILLPSDHMERKKSIPSLLPTDPVEMTKYRRRNSQSPSEMENVTSIEPMECSE